jgi:hypothetical protein
MEELNHESKCNVPSKEELKEEITKSNITNADSAFSSFLKIPSAGYRTNRGNIPENHPLQGIPGI